MFFFVDYDTVFFYGWFSRFSVSGIPRSPIIQFVLGKSKMAVSPYVSRAEIWLANSSFRSSFRLPEHFHPSIFVKWYPGHMAKGVFCPKVACVAKF